MIKSIEFSNHEIYVSYQIETFFRKNKEYKFISASYAIEPDIMRHKHVLVIYDDGKTYEESICECKNPNFKEFFTGDRFCWICDLPEK